MQPGDFVSMTNVHAMIHKPTAIDPLSHDVQLVELCIHGGGKKFSRGIAVVDDSLPAVQRLRLLLDNCENSSDEDGERSDTDGDSEYMTASSQDNITNKGIVNSAIDVDIVLPCGLDDSQNITIPAVHSADAATAVVFNSADVDSVPSSRPVVDVVDSNNSECMTADTQYVTAAAVVNSAIVDNARHHRPHSSQIITVAEIHSVADADSAPSSGPSVDVMDSCSSEYMTANSQHVTAAVADNSVDVDSALRSSQIVTIAEVINSATDVDSVPSIRPVVEVIDVRELSSGCLKRSSASNKQSAAKKRKIDDTTDSADNAATNDPSAAADNQRSASNEAVVRIHSSTSMGSSSVETQAKKRKLDTDNSGDKTTAKDPIAAAADGSNKHVECSRSSASHEAVVVRSHCSTTDDSQSTESSSGSGRANRCLLNTSTGTSH